MMEGAISLPHWDPLTAFGLLAVGLMLLFYAMEERSPLYVIAFAASCVMASIYGFMQGAWPFGLVEGVWSLVAIRRWHYRRMESKFKLQKSKMVGLQPRS